MRTVEQSALFWSRRLRGGLALKECGHRVDALGMTVQPDPTGLEWMSGEQWTCADCGSPIEAGAGTEKAFSICQPCYDAYVDNAGR